LNCSMVMYKIKNQRRKGLTWYIKTVICITVFISFGFVQPYQAATPEYQVKAVFLFNFSQFVEWPEQTFDNPKSPLIIGILGKDPFGSFLEEAIQNEEINGHPLSLKRFQKLDQVDTCHILFINPDISSKMDLVTKSLKGKNILTVSDANNFIKNGGMVRFFTENNKIKLRINLETIKAEKFTVSSKLLRLAEIVDVDKK